MSMSLENHELLVKVGTFLKNRRQELGMSVNDLCEDTGFTPGAVRMAERGLYNITVERLDKHCGALDVALWQLFKEVTK